MVACGGPLGATCFARTLRNGVWAEPEAAGVGAEGDRGAAAHLWGSGPQEPQVQPRGAARLAGRQVTGSIPRASGPKHGPGHPSSASGSRPPSGCSRRWEGVWVGPGWPPERSRRLGGAGPPCGRSLRRSPHLCFSHAEAQAAGAGQRTRPSPSSQAQPCRRRCFQSPASSTCHRCRLRPWTLQALSPLVPWPWALLVTVREGQGPPDASPERLSPPGPSAHEAGAACRGPSSREPPCPRRRPGLVPGLVPRPPIPPPGCNCLRFVQ